MSKSQIQQLGQYYTATQFGQLLVSSLNIHSPKTVVELGAGEGALLNAAKNRWNKAKLISVDIDKTNHRIIKNSLPNHSHYLINALDSNLPKNLGITNNSIDAAICNPPYIKSKWQASYSELLEEANISGCLPVHSEFSTDILFLAQNLRLLRAGGELGIIVPDGFITSLRTSKLREELANQHMLRGVIQLPTQIFKKTEAKTYIILLTKNKSPDEYIPLYKASYSGDISDPLFILTEQANKRLDYEHYLYTNKLTNNYKTLISKDNVNTTQKYNFEIARGNITKTDAEKEGLTYFHTTTFNDVKNSSTYKIAPNSFIKSNKNNKYITAKKGDILLARVGRRLHEKMACVYSGKIILTDCVYRIRAKDETTRKKIWDSLSSEKGRLWIKAQSKGVCAQSINKHDLLKLPIF